MKVLKCKTRQDNPVRPCFKIKIGKRMGDNSCSGGVCALGSRLHLRYCKQPLNGEEINPRELSERTEG